MTDKRPVRIANCSGFYGDRLSAAREMVEGGPIDVLSGDWLAELTMGILLRDRMKDPDRGYARTVLLQLEQVLGTCLERGIRIVTNAGGTNPPGLANALHGLLSRLDLPRAPKVAVITGDEFTDQLDDLVSDGVITHLDGEPWAPAVGMPLGANAYLGAQAVQQALTDGADVVITGRCTDAALVVGPAAWWHGWSPAQLDPLAGALVAGHIIECGAQATGGNYAFYHDIPGMEHVGFPIAEIHADGSSVITTHPGTGGQVTAGTVTAQLLYEVGSERYLSPDVVARLDTLQLDDDGDGRVRVSGARGEPPPPTVKAGVLSLSGHRNQITFLLGGDDIDAKADLLATTLWAAVGGREAFAASRVDVQRGDHPDVAPVHRISRVTFSVFSPDAELVGRRFGQKAVELALATVPGITLADLPDKPRPVPVFEPVLVPRERVLPMLQIDDAPAQTLAPPPLPAPGPPIEPAPGPQAPPPAPTGERVTVRLGDLCGARSGDKAGLANVGFFARSDAHWPALQAVITEEAVRSWVGDWQGPITLHPLPNLRAINVLLHGFLDRGVAANLAPDPQAKTLAEALRTAQVEVDAALLPDHA